MQIVWHVSSPKALIDTSQPLTYADRLRIRQPGDNKFALGPHQDGGSVERWEREGYGLGGVYDAIFAGRWEDYDPWEAGGRVDAVNNLYNGLGACSMFRMFQGWLSMSKCGPGQGTLLVNPLLKLATSYALLRPFFRPLRSSSNRDADLVDLAPRAGFLDPDNWVFTAGEEMTSDLQGATPGHGQEFSDELMHPHLELDRTMVHIPEVKPGDFVVWHCDSEFVRLSLLASTDIRTQLFTQSTKFIRARRTRACCTFPSLQSRNRMPNTLCGNARPFTRARPDRITPAARGSRSTWAAQQRTPCSRLRHCERWGWKSCWLSQVRRRAPAPLFTEQIPFLVSEALSPGEL
jgi:hypothetical protein